jgi:hypothetical protein
MNFASNPMVGFPDSLTDLGIMQHVMPSRVTWNFHPPARSAMLQASLQIAPSQSSAPSTGACSCGFSTLPLEKPRLD